MENRANKKVVTTHATPSHGFRSRRSQQTHGAFSERKWKSSMAQAQNSIERNANPSGFVCFGVSIASQLSIGWISPASAQSLAGLKPKMMIFSIFFVMTF
jgi:hypothetical protein